MIKHLQKGGEKIMLHVGKTITSVIAAGGIMLSTIAPAAFADVQISGNGAFSNNSVSTSSNTSQTVNQSNYANFNNTVSTHNNTGGNSSSFNTGGSTSVNTGSANSSVDISNRANSNVAHVGGMFMPFNNQNIGIFGNGYGSHNYVNSTTSNNTYVSQNNNSYINNNVNTHNNTGHNQSFGNTGGWWWGGGNGSSQTNTGNADSSVNINNWANSNMLH